MPRSGSAVSDVDLLSRDFAQDPHARYTLLREHPQVRKHVVKTLATEMYAWVVTGYDDSRALLADPRLAKDVDRLLDVMAANAVNPDDKPAGTPRSMLFSDPPDHTRLRKLVGNVFTMRRVERLRPWIEQAVDRLLDAVPVGEEFDLVERIGMALPTYVIGRLLGVPPDRHDDFRAWNSVLAGLENTAAEKREAHRRTFEYLTGLIADKRRDPGDDIVSALVAESRDNGSIDDQEVLSAVFLLMNAGYETTAHMISSGVFNLLRHRDQQALLRADLDLVPGAVEEFLRYESPLNMATIRFTAAPVRIGEVVVPAGEIVFVALLAANRDPARFADPDAFDVLRAEKAHLSFGHGIHHCIGAPLARMEGDIVFRKLLARFANWEPVVPETELRWKFSAQFRGLDRLPIRLS
ncbi:cytochrome P450 [Streptomyces sp. SID3343]|uniref:cytochrome P450 family protein n=1 Tax=Streptomyces sp. SID3343 TaxID=2690260 RepID=UPI00136CB466|nr:cytochrome P450 [Streptomyces sp. SID3343]MYW00291.1 cytochrome P450 [Streptomyces sp. SID3343]